MPGRGKPTVKLLDLVDGQLARPGQTLGLRAMVKDPEGIASTDFTLSGAVNTVIPNVFALPVDSTIVEASIILPASPSVDYVDVSAGAVNTLNPPLSGRSEVVRIMLSTAAVTDTVPPRVSLTVVEPPVGRVELGETIEIQVSGSDPSGDGVVETGYTVIATGTNLPATVVSTGSVAEASPNQGNVAHAFFLPILAVDSVNLPDTITYEVTDACGNSTVASVTVTVPLSQKKNK